MSRARIKGVPPRVNGRALTHAQAATLRAAARAEALGRSAQARQLRSNLEVQLGEAADAEWLAGALAETAALERMRGAELDVRPGRVRISGRDGLRALGDSGALDARRLAVGLRYRERLEAAQPRLGSALAIRPGGSGPPGLPERAAARIAQARRDLDRMERALAGHYAGAGRPALAADAVLVVREVAGLGRSIRSLAASGARRTVLTDRLQEALGVLADLAVSKSAGASDGRR